MQVNSVTVAVPVLNGGKRFKSLLEAVRAQTNAAGVELEILIVDSGSTDGSVEAAEAAGARVIEIDKRDFQHGRTRNMAVSEARGEVVAMLTDDAVPASADWLDAIVEGFAAADDVALVFGPQLPLPEHPHYVRREMIDHFIGYRGSTGVELQRQPVDDEQMAKMSFFSDANGALAKWAWAEHPYREVPYAEDQLIGREMIEAGYAKAFHPDAAVIHSHHYGALGSLRRTFDDYRGLYEVLGHRPGIGIRSGLRAIVSATRLDRAFVQAEGASRGRLAVATLGSIRHHALRVGAILLAAYIEHLPNWLTRLVSHEGRAGTTVHTG